MATYDEPDFRIVEREGRVSIACQHLRDDNQARMFDGRYRMDLPVGLFSGDVKLYFCPACDVLGQEELKKLVCEYIVAMMSLTRKTSD